MRIPRVQVWTAMRHLRGQRGRVGCDVEWRRCAREGWIRRDTVERDSLSRTSERALILTFPLDRVGLFRTSWRENC